MMADGSNGEHDGSYGDDDTDGGGDDDADNDDDDDDDAADAVDDDDDGDDDDYDEATPGIYPGERTKKKTDRAGDPTHYEGGGTDTAEKCTSNDIWKGRGRGRRNGEAHLDT